MTKRSAKARRKIEPLFAFYDHSGIGFLMYQDERGWPVAEGEIAIQRWKAIGMPFVASLGHAKSLGLVMR